MTKTQSLVEKTLSSANPGDGVVIVLANGTQQSAILTHFSLERAHFDESRFRLACGVPA